MKDLSKREGIEVLCKAWKGVKRACMCPSEKKFDTSTRMSSIGLIRLYHSGYSVKSGYQYGCDYILYEKKGEDHSHGTALVLIHDPDSAIQIDDEMRSFSRLASIVHKKAYYVVFHENTVFLNRPSLHR